MPRNRFATSRCSDFMVRLFGSSPFGHGPVSQRTRSPESAHPSAGAPVTEVQRLRSMEPDGQRRGFKYGGKRSRHLAISTIHYRRSA